MGDVKLSERIRKRKREYWADSDDMFRSGFERARLGYVADGLEEAAQIVEQHEQQLKSTNTELTKRVAELEARLRFTAESLRSLSPGPHLGPMDAEDYVPLIARLIADLQSQLAWTPVSAGLPTEEGPYEFTHVSDDSAIIHDFELWLYNPHEDEFESVTSTDVYVRDEFLDNNYYTHYRRIELPKGGES